MTSKSVSDEALAAHCRGWCVVPMGQKKFPSVPWKAYQLRLPTDEEIVSWFHGGSYHDNWGLIHGDVPGTVVIDFDHKTEYGGLGTVLYDAQDELGQLPTTPTVSTPRGGLHMIFRHPGTRVPTRKNVRTGIDIRGDGGFSVGPGSSTPFGSYTWIHPPDVMKLAELPLNWFEVVTEPLAIKPITGNRCPATTQSGITTTMHGIVWEDRPCPFGGTMPIAIDGREAHATRLIYRVNVELTKRYHRPPSYDELLKVCLAQFRATTDLTRPFPHSFEDKVKRIANSNTYPPTGS